MHLSIKPSIPRSLIKQIIDRSIPSASIYQPSILTSFIATHLSDVESLCQQVLGHIPGHFQLIRLSLQTAKSSWTPIPASPLFESMLPLIRGYTADVPGDAQVCESQV